MTKEEILAILESKCLHLKFTEQPSSKCLKLSSRCSQISCPIRAEIIADRLLEAING